jgi:hypothetical protein
MRTLEAKAGVANFVEGITTYPPGGSAGEMHLRLD